MEKTTLNMSKLNRANIQSINDCIRRMLDEERERKGALLDNTEFANNKDVIMGAFAPCPCPTCPHEFSKMDIYHRLILIDSLYSTNVNRMRNFGLEEMTDVIWDLCEDNNGIHTDASLAEKLSYSIDIGEYKKRSNFFTNLGIGACTFYEPIFKAFNHQYGYVEENNKIKNAGKAMSLLSKYFYFVALVQRVDDYGFPIYDKIVRGLIRPIEKYIGLLPLSINLDDMEKFIPAIKRIVDTLEAADPDLWDPKNSGKLKFDLLDYFLWHIGKAGEQSYKLLLTKTEYLSYYPNKVKLPQRIVEWEKMYNKIKL